MACVVASFEAQSVVKELLSWQDCQDGLKGFLISAFPVMEIQAYLSFQPVLRVVLLTIV
jgi:hypothetical protein